MESIISFDISVLTFIYENLRCAFLDGFMKFITLFGESGIFYICIALVMLFFKKTRKTGIMLSISLIIGLVVCNMTLKPIIARPRPYIYTGLEPLIERPTDFSFPSGHTVAAFEAATVFMLRDRRAGIPFLVLAILIAMSRLYLHVHYPTDIIGGIILGSISGIIAVKAVNWFCNKKNIAL